MQILSGWYIFTTFHWNLLAHLSNRFLCQYRLASLRWMFHRLHRLSHQQLHVHRLSAWLLPLRRRMRCKLPSLALLGEHNDKYMRRMRPCLRSLYCRFSRLRDLQARQIHFKPPVHRLMPCQDLLRWIEMLWLSFELSSVHGKLEQHVLLMCRWVLFVWHKVWRVVSSKLLQLGWA